jgi:hypothetical protein
MVYVYAGIGVALVLVLNLILKYSGTILSGALTLVFFIASQVTMGWEALGFIIIALLAGVSFVLGTILTFIIKKVGGK